MSSFLPAAVASLLDAHLITLVVFFPVAVGVALVATTGVARFVGLRSGLPEGFWYFAGLAASIAAFAGTLLLWRRFDPESPGFQMIEHVGWLAGSGVHYFVAVDGISLALVNLVAFLVPVVLFAARAEIETQLRSFVLFVLSLESAALGALVSLNLVVFYAFWEVMLIPIVLLIGVWGGARRIAAALQFFLFSVLGSVPLLMAILVLLRLNVEQGGALNFDLIAIPGVVAGLPLLETSIPVSDEVRWWSTQPWLLGAFALACVIRLPVPPFHSWSPDAQVEAPSSVAVLLVGVLVQVAGYALLRFALPLFPDAAVTLGPVLVGFALVAVVYGFLLAAVQSDLKRLVAYLSLGHVGFVVLGLAVLNDHGLSGAVLQMLNLGLSVSALLLSVGFLERRRRSSRIEDFGGIARPMPIFAVSFGVIAMASVGLPSLGGFVGEILVLIGVFGAQPWAGVVAAFGWVLLAAVVLPMLGRVIFGPVDRPENRGLIDLDFRERVLVFALIAPMLWIGVQPEPLLRRIEPAVIDTLDQMLSRAAPVTAESPPEQAQATPRAVALASAEFDPQRAFARRVEGWGGE